MTRGPGQGDRGRRAATVRTALGTRLDEPNTVHLGASRPGVNGTQVNNGRHLLPRSNGGQGQLSELVEHLAVAVTRHVRHLRQDALQVPPSVDELASILCRCAQTRPTATPAEHQWTMESWAAHHGQVTGRLLVTKAEAAELLGVSVRTVERLIAAGQLPLLHIERASRLRLTDIEAYVDSLAGTSTTGDQDCHGP